MLPPTLQGSRRVFRGRRFDVHALEVRGADGESHIKEVVVHPGAVVVLPLLEGDRVVLIRNERAAVGETLWELPAGTLEPGEPAEACAARELEEEAGYRAGRVEPLTSFYTSPGICTERMHAFVARDLEAVGQALEATERITVEPVSADEALAMAKDGRLRDAKSLAALLYWWTLARGGGR